MANFCHSLQRDPNSSRKVLIPAFPGLGQLSYDKGMPILVASQASESAGALRYSLLTQALAQEGIEEKQMGISEALKYAEGRVPKLYEERMGKEEKKKIQEPKLLEFKSMKLSITGSGNIHRKTSFSSKERYGGDYEA